MAASISSSIIACLKSFNEFIDGIGNLQEVNSRELVAGAWEDELGRLRMWAANIGAHQTGQLSLDFRLRDASHVREQIVKLLQSLHRKIQDAKDVLAEDGENDDEDDADDLMDDEDPKTEIQELQESIASTINCLFQMSMLVRKPTQHDVHLGSKGADVAAFEPFDYNHVKEKYPRADDALVKRLGSAITRRRKYLRYRERHAIKLRRGIDKIGGETRDIHNLHEDESVQDGISSIISDTVATDFQQQNQIEGYDDNTSDTGISQTSYASTLLSGGHITIPPPPKSSLGGVPFECPFCFYLITAHDVRSWNKHVFQDLQPYICIAPTCAIPDKLYPTRHEWLHHSNTSHPTVTAGRTIPKASRSFAACPLCTEEVQSGKQYDRHLSRHLQELALFILPGSEDSSETRDQDAESYSSAESVDLATSNDRQKREEKEGEREEEREERLEIQLTEKQRLLGPEHPDTLTSMANLASSYSKQGLHEEATEMRIQVTDIRKKVLGPEHPATLASMANLASSYSEQGRLEAAIDLQKQVMMIRRRDLGMDRPATLTSMESLVSLYSKHGSYFDAETLQKRVISIKKQVRGPEHPDTLISMTHLGSLYRAFGFLDDALKVYHRAWVGEVNTLGPEHPSTLKTVSILGSLYIKLAQPAEAEDMYQRLLSAEERTAESDNAVILNIVNVLGNLYKDQGKMSMAEMMYQRALHGREKIFGRKHASTIEVVNNLSGLYRKEGRLVEAEEVVQWALE